MVARGRRAKPPGLVHDGFLHTFQEVLLHTSMTRFCQRRRRARGQYLSKGHDCSSVDRQLVRVDLPAPPQHGELTQSGQHTFISVLRPQVLSILLPKLARLREYKDSGSCPLMSRTEVFSRWRAHGRFSEERTSWRADITARYITITTVGSLREARVSTPESSPCSRPRRAESAALSAPQNSYTFLVDHRVRFA